MSWSIILPPLCCTEDRKSTRPSYLYASSLEPLFVRWEIPKSFARRIWNPNLPVEVWTPHLMLKVGVGTTFDCILTATTKKHEFCYVSSRVRIPCLQRIPAWVVAAQHRFWGQKHRPAACKNKVAKPHSTYSSLNFFFSVLLHKVFLFQCLLLQTNEKRYCFDPFTDAQSSFSAIWLCDKL